MAHIPYGYRVENGKVVIDENQAETVRTIFQEYLKGASLMECARASGYNRKHSSIGRILMNEKYLGDGFYPPLIEDEMFYEAAEERYSRASRLGRIRDYSAQKKAEKKAYSYSLGKVEANAKLPYPELADELNRLRDKRRSIQIDEAEKAGIRKRIDDMKEYLRQVDAEISEYDEGLVRTYFEKITVYDDRFEIEFKTGVKVDIAR